MKKYGISQKIQTSNPEKSELFNPKCEIKKQYRPNVWYNVITTKHQTHTRGLHYEQYKHLMSKMKSVFLPESRNFSGGSRSVAS